MEATIEVKQEKDIARLLSSKPIVVSGPCSAETEEQLLQTAKSLSELGNVNILRAGIWKPRTKPGNFEGVGKKGLPWLQKASELTGLPTMVEVATAKHVEDALAFDVNILWIGARTTVNPFSVQEVADALKGVDIPVFIKNPVNPDIDLWIGAYERLAKVGIKSLGFIHRGFSSSSKKTYRNAPMWNYPIDLKLRFPNVPMICDPSHICGNRTNLQSIAQQSINLDFDGIMIESHYDPDNAWSDAKQQVTPKELGQILDGLIWRHEEIDTQEVSSKLEQLREDIDNIDDQILSILSGRMKISERIGLLKKQNKITIVQPDRWNDIVEHSVSKGKTLGLSKKFIETYFEAIHLESIRKQNEILDVKK